MPFPSPGDLPNPGIETSPPVSPALQADSFLWRHQGNPKFLKVTYINSKCTKRQCRRCQFDPWVRKIPWRRKWQPPPVFLPGKPHGQRSLAGYSPWGCKRVRHDLAAKQQQKSSLSSRKELGIVQTNHKCSSPLCQ